MRADLSCCVPAENPCERGFSNVPAGDADIASIVRAIHRAAGQKEGLE